jgi:hypothetical protein
MDLDANRSLIAAKAHSPGRGLFCAFAIWL